MKKRIKFTITKTYEIEFDTENEIIKEYEDDQELVSDLAGYDMSNVLPVMKEIKVIDEDKEYEII